MPALHKRWQIAPEAPPSHIAQLSHLHRVTAQVCYNRGLTHPDEVETFLGEQQDEVNPFSLEGLAPAVTRLRQALRARERIVVYGDFDVDGVTATALLVQTLKELGGEVRAYIPHRVDEGYGLNKRALTQLAHDRTQLVVTVDCGIRSLDEVAHANALGLDVIVTDHHSPGPRLPEAVAVIDPKRSPGCDAFHELAGVGVAYRLAQGLLRSHREVPVTPRQIRLEEDDLLDLVALGTVADVVPLLGENRVLATLGLEHLNRMERPGIDELCQVAGLKEKGRINARAIGYALGPRLNAAGRLSRADTAYDLLVSEFPAEVKRLAEELNQLNEQRRELTRQLRDRVREAVLAGTRESPLLFAADRDFPVGVVGLVASRLADEFYRPAIVANVGDGVTRGSARSIPEFNIIQALDRCQDILVRHGGHAGAAGFTVPNDKWDELVARLRRIAANQLAGVELSPVISIDARADLSELSPKLLRELADLRPYGCANPRPLLASFNVRVARHWAVGRERRHLKMKLLDHDRILDAIAFGQSEWVGKLPDRVDLVYYFEENEWNGIAQPQLRVQEIRPAEHGDTVGRLWIDEDEPGRSKG